MTDSDLDRRKFVAGVMAGITAAGWCRRAVAEDRAGGSPIQAGSDAGLALRPARWWKDAGELRVTCELCPRACRVADRERGACGVRENRGGKYHTLVYARPCAIHLDPIEKKPFYHVLPGKTALSVGCPGCNFECKFCQNWEIAQVRPDQIHTYDTSPARVVELAGQQGAPTIACTYTEPVVWSEYVYDIAARGKPVGLRTLLVSNGFIQPKAMNDLIDVLGAVKIDLKSFSDGFYRQQCRGELQPVLETLRLLAKRKVWTEIVVLIIPGLNDSEQEARALARFVKNDLGPDVPVHFTRFHPSYRLMNVPATPVATLSRIRDMALAEGLRFPYVGNVLGHPGNHTYCPGCKKLLVRRTGMAVSENRIKAGKCPGCGRQIPGIWQ